MRADVLSVHIRIVFRLQLEIILVQESGDSKFSLRVLLLHQPQVPGQEYCTRHEFPSIEQAFWSKQTAVDYDQNICAIVVFFGIFCHTGHFCGSHEIVIIQSPKQNQENDNTNWHTNVDGENLTSPYPQLNSQWLLRGEISSPGTSSLMDSPIQTAQLQTHRHQNSTNGSILQL